MAISAACKFSRLNDGLGGHPIWASCRWTGGCGGHVRQGKRDMHGPPFFFLGLNLCMRVGPGVRGQEVVQVVVCSVVRC